MVGWHHQLNGQEFEQAQGDSEGQGSLACCSPLGRKESDMTERLNNNNNNNPFSLDIQSLSIWKISIVFPTTEDTFIETIKSSLKLESSSGHLSIFLSKAEFHNRSEYLASVFRTYLPSWAGCHLPVGASTPPDSGQ